MIAFYSQLAWLGGAGEWLSSVDAAMPGLNSLLLLITILLPLLCGAILLVFDREPVGLVRVFARTAFLVPALLSVWLWASYVAIAEAGEYLFLSDISTGLDALGISLKLGLNGISAPLLLLTGIVGLAAGLYGLEGGDSPLRAQLGLLLVMLGGLFGVFGSIDLFFFYFFHEFALIPTFLIIGLWGGRGRRAAAMEMTIYLTVGAMLSLAGLIAVYVQSGLNSFDMITLREHLAGAPIGEVVQRYSFGLLLFGFGILVALWPLHVWAPRGYAAAPPALAMLHAGVLKKFGLYGLVQVALPLLPSGAMAWAPLLIYLALGNVIIIGLVAMAQRDLKMLLGYGSVMHMGYVFLGIACFSTVGLSAAVFLMFAHGLSVALLFLLAGSVERRTGTTDLFCMGGLARRTPVLAGFFVLAIFASIGLPGFANFWGELGVFVAVFQLQKWLGAVVILGVIISAVYGLRAINRIFYGEASEALDKHCRDNGEPNDLTRGEKGPVLLLVFTMLLTGILPGTIADGINQGVEQIYPPGHFHPQHEHDLPTASPDENSAMEIGASNPHPGEEPGIEETGEPHPSRNRAVANLNP